jgi:hypothetical protein
MFPLLNLAEITYGDFSGHRARPRAKGATFARYT